MVGDGVLTLRTGPGGSGKSYWVVKWIMDELLPYYRDSKVVTNLPLLTKDPRIVLRDFPEGWSPEEHTLDDGSVVVRDPKDGSVLDNSFLVIDEAHRVFNKQNDRQLRAVVGISRHHSIRWVMLSQSKDKLPSWVDEEAEIWFESANGRSLRDSMFGFRLYDIQNVYAKLFGKFYEFFRLTEYVRSNRRWKAIGTYNEWFQDRIGQFYNTKNKGGVKDTGEPEVVHDYMRFSLPTLLCLVAKRNWHCVPMFCIKNGAPLAMIASGLGLCWYMSGWATSPPKPVAAPAPVIRPNAVKSEPSRPVNAAVAERPAPRAILTWLVLAAVLLAGCVGPRAKLQSGPEETHVGREAATDLPSPRVAVIGPGHSLDQALKQAGIEAHTQEQVDGPLVGREVIQAARRFGFDLDATGTKLHPTERHTVVVPDELKRHVKEGVQEVGGGAVKRATLGEIDDWRELSNVVFESYAIDLLIVSIADDQSRNLGIVTSAVGDMDIAYPGRTTYGGRARVRLTVDGSFVEGREIARPVLHATHDAETNIHVGAKYPVRLTQTSSDGTTRAVGSTISYVSTGIEVGLKPSRVSSTQVRLTGSVSVSEQTAVSDGAPVTAERRVSVDQFMTLGQWGPIARLDRQSTSNAGAWFGVGGLRRQSADTFVVVACPRQVMTPKQPKRAEPLPEAEKTPLADIDDEQLKDDESSKPVQRDEGTNPPPKRVDPRVKRAANENRKAVSKL